MLNGMGLEAIQGYDRNGLLGNYFNKDLGEDLSVVEREEREKYERERRELARRQAEMETEIVKVRSPAYEW